MRIWIFKLLYQIVIFTNFWCWHNDNFLSIMLKTVSIIFYHQWWELCHNKQSNIISIQIFFNLNYFHNIYFGAQHKTNWLECTWWGWHHLHLMTVWRYLKMETLEKWTGQSTWIISTVTSNHIWLELFAFAVRDILLALVYALLYWYDKELTGVSFLCNKKCKVNYLVLKK